MCVWCVVRGAAHLLAELLLERRVVLVREGARGAAREGRADRGGEVHPLVHVEEVALAHEGGDHGGDGGDAEGVDDGLVRVRVRGQG